LLNFPQGVAKARLAWGTVRCGPFDSAATGCRPR